MDSSLILSEDCYLKNDLEPVCFWNTSIIYVMAWFVGESSGAMSREDFIDATAQDVLSKLPAEFEIWRVRKQFEMNITPTLVVLLQELERYTLR